MIKRATEFKPVGYTEVYYDIETTETGEFLSLGWTTDDYVFRHVEGFGQFLAEVIKLPKPRLWAHNGWRFDHLFFLRELYDNFLVIDGTFQNGRVTFLTLVHTRTKKKLTLSDSFNLFQTSLANVCLSFNKIYFKKRIDVSPEYLYKNDFATYLEYLRGDVLGLCEAMNSLLLLVTRVTPGISSLPNTIGTLALQVFRLNLTRDIIPSSLTLDKYERESYFGGVCQCLKVGEFSSVTAIDVNSMYPSVMIGTKYPVAYTGYWTYQFDSQVNGLWKGRFDTKPHKFVYDTQSRRLADTGCCILDTDTVVWMRQHYGEHSFILEKGYVYIDNDYIFDYLTTYYNLKSSTDEIGLKTVCKYLLNSTSGKFGQKHEHTKIGALSGSDIEKLIKQGQPVHEHQFAGQTIYSWKNFKICKNTFCVLSSLITLKARLKLWKAFKRLTEANIRVLYMDTDSLHYIGEPNDLLPVSKRLGEWSVVFTGAAGYAGRKLYYYQENGHATVKAKGVSDLTLTEIQQLIREGEVEGKYFGCTTPRQVLFKDQLPGVFKHHPRTLHLQTEVENDDDTW